MYRDHLSLIVQHRFVAFREKTNQIKPIYILSTEQKTLCQSAERF
jgi:hypothetical protein